ncbi:MAG: putative lipid II flippase FtsW [Candidatus Nealsonbacteria bacterium]|nr:putative lipid II flippase FtsW [Candidatus Nealsonbacteria bacterium]
MLKNRPNYILIATVFLLLLLGILILASASAPLSQMRFGNTFHFLNRQVFNLGPGLILAFLAFIIPLSFWKKFIFPLLLINLVFLAMVFIPGIGIEIGGAKRWIDLGIITFQPAEFLKLTFIVYLAAWLANRTEKVKSNLRFGQNLIVFLIIIGTIALFFFFQPNIGTFGIIALTAFFMYFAAATPVWHSIFMIFLGLSAFFILIKVAPYRLERLLVFLNPGTDPLGMGYHIKQSLIAIGSGGIAGLGLGMSVQKFGFLPASLTDSIFAVFAEETGFIGVFILIALFLIFFWQGWKIAKNSRDKFCQLTALGISSWIIIQAFVNICSMVGLLPLTGIPLPFISYGGSHLIAELIGVGILLNISKQ